MTPASPSIVLSTVLASLIAQAPAADFVKGYTKYAGSELLEVNNPGAGGEILFVDQAETGGGDLVANAGNPDWGWSIVGDDDWLTGDAVTFTGLAMPIWADDPDTVGTNNTQNASWRIRFYSAGPDGEWDGTSSIGTGDDSFIDEVTVQFNSAGAGTDEYYVNFDTPIAWTADSSKIWFYCQALNNKALRLKTGTGGATAIREKRVNGDSLATNPTLRMSLAGTVVPAIPRGTQLEWIPSAPGDNQSLYQEANWIDPDTGTTPSAGTVNPNLTLDRSLIVRTGNPGGGAGAGGNLLLGTGDLSVSHATLRMSKGSASGINMGTSWRDLTITDGKVLTQSITNGKVVMQGRSELTLYGPNPLINTTIDLQSSDCFVLFLDRLPSDVDGAYLDQFTVNGAPAVLNTNVHIRQYYNGAVIRPSLPGGIALKAFDLPDLEGTQWNFTTGFKGIVGLGLSSHDAGQYTIAGWGADIWGSGDECHFSYRTLSGDGEIIAKVDSVQNTHLWAKGGVMIRESLADGSPNVFMFQRPDGTVTYQSRVAADGATTSSIQVAASWVRLTRSGNTFTSYYSTTSSTGPWTQAGTDDITMPSTVLIGLAVTSHIGVERSTSVFSEVSMLEGAVPAPASNIGIFDDTAEIDAPWTQDDQISSFLLKKGYMVTLAEDAGGQGFSKVYVATEADLKINLPTELDNNVTFMRVLPWRWIAKKGWAGAADVFPAVIETHWKYEWEPTGFSNLNWEFVPMIRGDTQDKDFRWEEVRVRGGQTHFLGFNEPNLASQGNLTVDEAIALWPKAQQLGLRLGSPARTDNGPGDTWLMDFMTEANARGYRVDYICVHNYAHKTGAALQNWLDTESAKYGLPIWLTEFQRDTDSDNPTAADHEAYLADVLPMLEGLSYLERYAYYNFNTETPSNNFASLFNPDDTVNAKGQLYLDLVSNPAYRNTGQPAWATAAVDQNAGEILQVGTGGVITASTSLNTSTVSSVEFFVNGISVGTDASAPFELSTAALGAGVQTIYAVFTTSFGEQVVSASKQVIVTDFALLPTSPGPTGEISWSAVPGESYRLESSDDFQSIPVWELEESRVATGFVETATDPDWATELKRFYRVVWE